MRQPMDFEQFDSLYLRKLNPQQREAVLSLNGKILLLATPGSGKTTVLVTRLGYMICCKGIDPRSILTVTYTRAATQDMKRRFAQLFGEEAAAPVDSHRPAQELRCREVTGDQRRCHHRGFSGVRDKKMVLSALVEHGMIEM